ncbi:MAG: ATP-binding protein [Chloroflexi bacterium]|nr:ATP-binding protein [Chloroflexota bacterium]
MSQQKSLTVPGRYDQIRVICEFVADGAKNAPFSDDEIFHIELACDEACTNIIEHAYSGEDQGPIEVTWDVQPEGFTITLTDQGETFDPTAVPTPSTPTELNNLEELDNVKVGGLGLHFMKKLMDKVIFTFKEGKGNQLIMIKEIKGKV